MIYGIEQSTDMRCPQTVIAKFTSRRSAMRWLEPARLTHGEDAETVQNFHHTLRTAYEMPVGFRLPSPKQLSVRAFKNSSSAYPRNSRDIIASIVRAAGTKVIADRLESR